MFANLRYFLLPVLNITGPVLIAFACLLLLPVLSQAFTTTAPHTALRSPSCCV